MPKTGCLPIIQDNDGNVVNVPLATLPSTSSSRFLGFTVLDRKPFIALQTFSKELISGEDAGVFSTLSSKFISCIHFYMFTVIILP